MKCLQSVYENAWEHQAGEWKQEKRKILHSMIAPSGSFLELGSNKSIFMEATVPTTPFLGTSETLYASKIMEYNNNVTKNSQQQDLVAVFTNISQEFKDAVSSVIFNNYIAKACKEKYYIYQM